MSNIKTYAFSKARYGREKRQVDYWKRYKDEFFRGQIHKKTDLSPNLTNSQHAPLFSVVFQVFKVRIEDHLKNKRRKGLNTRQETVVLSDVRGSSVWCMYAIYPNPILISIEFDKHTICMYLFIPK